MTGCPTYQVVAGGTPIDIASQKLPAPHGLGDEQWSQLLTFSAGGRSTVVKQTAIRDGSLLLIVSGSPGPRRPPPRQGPRQGHGSELTGPDTLAAPTRTVGGSNAVLTLFRFDGHHRCGGQAAVPYIQRRTTV